MAKTKPKTVKKTPTTIKAKAKSKAKAKVKPATTTTASLSYRSSNNYNNTPQTPGVITLNCTAEGCNKAFSYVDGQLARKALMRHLHHYKALAEAREEEEAIEEDSKGQKKREFENAHYTAWTIEKDKRKTSEEKQKNSRELYKLNNQEKVARASRISNFRAQAKKIPEIASRGWGAIVEWAEEKELAREKKLQLEKEDEDTAEQYEEIIKKVNAKKTRGKGKGKAVKKGN